MCIRDRFMSVIVAESSKNKENFQIEPKPDAETNTYTRIVWLKEISHKKWDNHSIFPQY